MAIEQVELILEKSKQVDQVGHTGVLLVNLGTPDSPRVIDVKRYLRQFLSDPRVIDINKLARWLLLNLIILPIRPFISSRAYQSIWMPEGSPLLVHGKNLEAKLQTKLGASFKVALGMRYGKPSIQQAITSLDLLSCKKVIVFPLFPHYASASTGSAIAEVFNNLAESMTIPELQTFTDYFSNEHYINALYENMANYLGKINFDFLLMSYHGLPERQILKNERTKRCDLKGPCPKIQKDNRYCYRAQCYQTSRMLAEKLKLPDEKWMVSFQSRLGKTPWIKPYTDEVLVNLYNKGVRKLAVCCPAFTADCLETLEEIGIRANEDWQALGGESLHLIPCLNDSDVWVDAIYKILKV